MRFSNLIRSKAVSRSCVVLAAAAMSMSLAACGGGNKDASATKEEPKVLEKIDEDTFAVLGEQKLGPLDKAKLYNRFVENALQKIKESRDLFAELSPNLTITPEKCRPLSRLGFSLNAPVEDYNSVLIAGKTEDANDTHTFTLFLKPSETVIKEYESTTQELLNSCREINLSAPGRNEVTVKLTPFDPGSYKQVKHIVGYQLEETNLGNLAVIEAILENGQAIQIQDYTPENAVNILKDAFKHLQIS